MVTIETFILQKKPISESFTSYLLKALPVHIFSLGFAAANFSMTPRNGALLSQAMATISRLLCVLDLFLRDGSEIR